MSLRIEIIRDMLSGGYGVEDIAVRFGIPVEYVRATVRRMRAAGHLAAIYRARRAEP